MAAVPSCDLVAGRSKAVLKHAQSKRWREVRCGPANAKSLDCVRFIAAVSRPHSTRTTAKIRREGSPTSGFGFIARAPKPSPPGEGMACRRFVASIDYPAIPAFEFSKTRERESPLRGERVWVREVVAWTVGADVRRLTSNWRAAPTGRCSAASLPFVWFVYFAVQIRPVPFQNHCQSAAGA